MAEELSTGTTDIIIPLSVETGNVDQTLETLEKHVDSLRSKLSQLTEDSQEYINVQSRLSEATDKLASTTEKLDSIFNNVSAAGVKMANNTKVINDSMTAMTENTSIASDVLDTINANFIESGESAKEAAQGTEWYNQTLEELSKEGGIANVTLNELKATQKDLEKEMANTSIGSDKWKGLNADLKLVKNAITETKKAQHEATEETVTGTNSIAAMRRNVSELKKEWVNADFGSPQFEQLTADLAEANTKLTEMEQAVGIGGRNVGNYKSALDGVSESLNGMIPGIGGVTKGLGALTKQALAFIATPVGAIITAITVALKAVHEAFTRSAEGQEKFNVLMGYISGAVTVLLDLLADLGEWLIKVFTEPEAAFADFKKYVLNPATIGIRTIANAAQGAALAVAGIFSKDAREESKKYFAQIKQDWKEVKDTAVEVWNGVTNKLGEVVDKSKESAEIARMENDLKQKQLEASEKLAENERKIADLRQQAADKEKLSAGERQALLKQAMELEEQNGNIRVDLAQREYDIQVKKNGLGKTNIEDLQKEQDLKNAIFDADRDKLNKLREMTAQNAEIGKAAADKAKADQSKANADYIKAMQDRIKAAEDVAKAEVSGDEKTLTAYKKILAEREAELAKASEKRLTLSELEKSELELQEYQHQKNLAEIDAAAANKALDDQLKEQATANKALEDAEKVAIAERKAIRIQAETELLAAQTAGDEAAITTARKRLNAIDAAELEHQQAVRDREAENIRIRMEIIRAGLENEAIIGAERTALQQQLADAENALLLNTASTAEAAAKRELKAEQDLAKSQKELEDKKVKNKKKAVDTINNLIAAGTAVVGEGTVASKALGVAQATVNTYVGASQALTDKTIPNTFARIAAMAAVIGAGLMQVKNILSVQVPNVGGGESAGAMPSVSPSVVYSAPIMETHTNMTSDEVDEINAAQKVYVVESDITETQERVKVAVTESTF